MSAAPLFLTQTAAVRKLRRDFKSGALSSADYEKAIDQQIAFAIGVQARTIRIKILHKDVHSRRPENRIVEYMINARVG